MERAECAGRGSELFSEVSPDRSHLSEVALCVFEFRPEDTPIELSGNGHYWAGSIRDDVKSARHPRFHPDVRTLSDAKDKKVNGEFFNVFEN
jgi:hypothetical protein